MKTYNIKAEQVRTLLAHEESHFFDFKSKEISPSKMSKTLVAFANSDGGDLVIGISEISRIENKRQWIGFSRLEDANAHIQVIESIFPIGQFCEIYFLKNDSDGSYVLWISVQRTPDIRRTSDSCVYIRRNAQDLLLIKDEEIRRLELEKGLISAEDYASDISISNIVDSKILEDFLTAIVPHRKPLEWLQRQNLLMADGRPKNAAVLLYSDEPQVALPKSAVKIYRYKTDTLVGHRNDLEFDPISIEGSIYSIIFSCVEKVVSIIEGISVMRSGKMVRISYPKNALHEVITNAVIHRDYSVSDDIHIRIFDNRVEVQSPGKLPGHVTVRNVLQERFARNPKVVRLINKFPNPPNKDVGEGLRTTFDAMKQMRLREPQISQPGNAVLVTLRHEALASREDQIINFLKTERSINNSKAREICNVQSEREMRKIFENMIVAGEIERVPGTARGSSAYRLSEKNRPPLKRED